MACFRVRSFRSGTRSVSGLDPSLSVTRSPGPPEVDNHTKIFQNDQFLSAEEVQCAKALKKSEAVELRPL